MLSEKELLMFRGKALVSSIDGKDVLAIFEVMDAMEELLGQGDEEDTFGTEGWRHHFGWDE